MKFPLLAVGARFEYEGKVYVKVGPLLAAAEVGGSHRLIPRYAMVRPLGEAGAAAAAPAPRRLDEAAVRAAFDTFHDTCARLLEEAGGHLEAREREALRASLAQARGLFLDTLRP